MAAKKSAAEKARTPAAEGPIDVTVDTFSDGAALLAFDPEVCAARRDLGLEGLRKLAKAGQFAWFGLGGDMAYRVRVTDGELTALERAHAKRPPVELALEVASGRIYVSGNDPPGSPAEDYEGGAGEFVRVPNGLWRVIAHIVEAPSRRTKALRDLPDFVLVLAPRKGKVAFVGERVRNPFTGKMEERFPPSLFD